MDDKPIRRPKAERQNPVAAAAVESVDPEVRAQIEARIRRQTQQLKESSKPRRDRSWDARRKRVTIDLPPELIADVKRIIQEISQANDGAEIGVSEAYALLIQESIHRYDAGQLRIRLRPRKYGLSTE